MLQASPAEPIQKLLHTVKTLECEHHWYSAAFKLLQGSRYHGASIPDGSHLTGLLERTHQVLMCILPFANSGFYLFNESREAPLLKYWSPASSERLFRNSVNTWISGSVPKGRIHEMRTFLYQDRDTGESLLMEPIATPDSIYGVFVGLYDRSALRGGSRKTFQEISSILGDLAGVLAQVGDQERLVRRKSEEPPLPRPASILLSDDQDGQGSLNAHPVPRAEIQHPSTLHDLLTNLPKSALVDDRLNMALAHARCNGEKVAVLIFDIDNFKRMNDFFGNPYGDMILKHLARCIRACLREEDTLGRNGGDEFIILLPDIHLVQDIEFRAQKIFEAIRVPFAMEGRQIHASCSAGISIYPDDGEDSRSLVNAARAAMFQAKEDGKDRFHFFKPPMLSRGYWQMGLEGELRQALERDEFRLHFQPKISISTGKVQGMEALLRWQHPKLGWVAPADFIPVAEELGLIQAIGEWVFLNSCRQIRAWKRAGIPPIRIAVNLSGYQVNQTQWIPTLERVLSRTGVDPQWLETEITETVLMDNSDVALANLHRMNDMGIRISIDDFGTGYSSLSYLKRFPIHSLKIDRSFIKGISERGKGTDAVITKAIVSLAQALNLNTVAEGVERAEERAYLESIGCNELQGFLFSKPRPVEEINYMFSQRLERPVRTYWSPEIKPQSV